MNISSSSIFFASSIAFSIELTFLGEIEQKTKITKSELPNCEIIEFKQACYGTFVLSNGIKYIGEWKDNHANGQGTSYFRNGNKYIGEFKDGKLPKDL